LTIFCDFFSKSVRKFLKISKNARKSYPQKLSTLEIAAVGPTKFLSTDFLDWHRLSMNILATEKDEDRENIRSF